MPVSIRIPEVLTKNLFPHTHFDDLNDSQIAHAKKSAKLLIERAITENKEPASVKHGSENDFVGHLTINILNKYNRAIIKHARQNKTPEAVVALGYLVTALNHDWHMAMIEKQETQLSAYLKALHYKERDEQQVFYRFLDDTMTQKKVGLIEASTGVGKTLGILTQANERALKDEKICAIATNSLANIQQYLEDYHALIEHDVEMTPLHLIMGRQNFVSSERLTTWLESIYNDVNKDAVTHWLRQSGKNSDEPEYLPAMTLASLKKAEPGIIDSEVVLTKNTSDDDLGYQSYQHQFSSSQAMTKGIVIVSHSMLCIDAKFRRLHQDINPDTVDDLKSLKTEMNTLYQRYDDCEPGVQKDDAYEAFNNTRSVYQERRMAALKTSSPALLPNYHYLFIDEAHLLENAMCNATSESISLRSIIRDAKSYTGAGKPSQSKLAEAEKTISELISSYSVRATDEMILSKQTEHENYLLHSLCNTMLYKKRKYADNPAWRDQLIQLKAGLNRIGKQNFTCILSFSPIRRYPQINTGESNVMGYLSDIWARTEAVALVSATLYIKRYNTYSSNYISNILAISRQRRMEYPPVVAQWTRDIVKSVNLPPADMENNETITPIGRGFRGTEEERAEKKHRWNTAISQYIADIYNNAPGGTLVLMTAYADCADIGNILSKELNNAPIVIADSNTTLDEQKQAYIAHTKAGNKPLWLAVGNAWVGLDINGKSIGLKQDEIFDKDNVITDLIIPKIPFGTNNSLSHMLRTFKLDNRTSDIELMETLMRFKQGLGRLVRLEHQPPNRQIHILDGRLTQVKYKGFLSLIRALIDTYPNVNTINELRK